MGTRPRTRIEDYIKAVELISQVDPQSGIAVLTKLKDEDGFHPWGALTLSKMLIADGQLAEAKRLSDSLAETRPDFVPNWPQQMRLSRSTASYGPVVRRILAEVRKKEKLVEGWLRRDYLEAAMGCAPDECEAVLAPALAGGLLDRALADGVRKLVPFASAVRAAVARSAAAPPGAWCFAFLGPGEACRDVDGVARVNLSALEIDGQRGWEQDLAGPLVAAMKACMGWAPYFNDHGVPSWRAVSEKDAHSAVFWNLLLARATEDAPAGPRRFHVPPAEPRLGELWIRPGNVELWALWSHLHDRGGARAAAESAALRLARAAEANAHPAAEEGWWPRISAVDNITRLSTNAGWYAEPGRAADAFSDWAERYLDALQRGNLLAGHMADLLRIAALAPGFRGQWPRHWRDEAIVSLLDGADVVLVTAFARELAEHHESGGLAALWGDLGIKGRVRSLRTVPAPMSIWPYRPDADWSESFGKLREESARAVEAGRATVFLASCGCYGLPLVHEMHRRFGISSLYYGHATNMYFGLRTHAFKGAAFYLAKPDSPHWLSVDLARRYRSVSRIDGGRYVPEPAPA